MCLLGAGATQVTTVADDWPALDNSFDWTVPANLTLGAGYQLLVVDTQKHSVKFRPACLRL